MKLAEQLIENSGVDAGGLYDITPAARKGNRAVYLSLRDKKFAQPAKTKVIGFTEIKGTRNANGVPVMRPVVGKTEDGLYTVFVHAGKAKIGLLPATLAGPIVDKLPEEAGKTVVIDGLTVVVTRVEKGQRSYENEFGTHRGVFAVLKSQEPAKPETPAKSATKPAKGKVKLGKRLNLTKAAKGSKS
jgi:hypothetical protein